MSAWVMGIKGGMIKYLEVYRVPAMLFCTFKLEYFMFRYVIVAATLMYAQAALACPMADAAAFSEAAALVAKAEGAKATFTVDGLTCNSCSEKVTTALKSVEGVVLSAVDYQTGRIEIAYNAEKTDLVKIESAIVGTGYKITEKPQG